MGKLIAMWFSLLGLIALFLGGIPVLIVRQLPEEALSKTLTLTEVIVSCLVGIPAILLLVYGAVCLWLLLWRFFATQAEIKKVAGPMTKWDRFLVKFLGPQR